MKLTVIILTFILFSSCNEGGKKQIKKSREDTVKVSIESDKSSSKKKSQPDFKVMYEILKDDPNINIASYSEKHLGNSYVICYMQRHPITKVREKISNFSTKDRKKMNLIQANLGKSILYSISRHSFPIYVEGFNQELGLINLSKPNEGHSALAMRGDIFLSLKKSKNRVYGIETNVSRGKNIALRTLEEDRSLFLINRDYNNLSSKERKPIVVEYILTLPQRIDLLLQENARINFNSLISRTEISSEVLYFKKYLKDGLLDCKNGQGSYVRLYLNYTKLIRERAHFIRLEYRNKIAIDAVPNEEPSVLVLGAAHFRIYHKDLGELKENIYIEELLDNRKLNYILIESK